MPAVEVTAGENWRCCSSEGLFHLIPPQIKMEIIGRCAMQQGNFSPSNRKLDSTDHLLKSNLIK